MRIGARGGRVAIGCAAALVLVTVSVIGWLHTLPLIDHDEVLDVVARSRALLAEPTTDARSVEGIEGIQCRLAAWGPRSESDEPTAPLERQIELCRDLDTRLRAERDRDDAVRDVRSETLLRTVEFLTWLDDEAGQSRRVRERVLDALWLLARLDPPSENQHFARDETRLVELLALHMLDVSDEEREGLVRRSGEIHDRRASRLARVFRQGTYLADPPAHWSGDDDEVRVWVHHAHGVAVSERMRSVGCGRVSTRDCVSGLRAPDPSLVPHHWRRLLFGPRFDRCTVIGCFEILGDPLDVTSPARAQLAITVLDEIARHDSAQPCHGSLPHIDFEGEPLAIDARRDAWAVMEPRWMTYDARTAPQAVVVLPCGVTTNAGP